MVCTTHIDITHFIDYDSNEQKFLIKKGEQHER